MQPARSGYSYAGATVYKGALWGKSDGSRVSTHTSGKVAGYRRQCLAAGSGDIRRAAKYSRADGTLRRHRQEEVGDQLRLHVDVRLRVGPRGVDPVRLQHGVRTEMVSIPGHAGFGDLGRFYAGSGNDSRSGLRYAAAGLSDGDAGLLPVRIRRHHG